MQLAIPRLKVKPLRTLYNKLCRELAQSECSARVHSQREARRLGDTPPARALRALGAHTQALAPQLASLIEAQSEPLGATLGRKVGALFSALRVLLFDRMIDLERSYRGTLLGFHHGLAVARLLRDVAERLDERDMVAFCERWLRERDALVDAAERELHWFAEVPKQALRSGFRVVFEPAPD